MLNGVARAEDGDVRVVVLFQLQLRTNTIAVAVVLAQDPPSGVHASDERQGEGGADQEDHRSGDVHENARLAIIEPRSAEA